MPSPTSRTTRASGSRSASARTIRQTSLSGLPIRERDVEQKIHQYCQRNRILFLKLTSPGRRGLPDRVVITPAGAVGFLEIKRPGEKPDARQLYEIFRLQAFHVAASWTDDARDGIQWICRIDNPGGNKGGLNTAAATRYRASRVAQARRTFGWDRFG